MKKEIEVLVQVFDPKQVVLGKLNDYSFQGIKTVHDIYFVDPLREDLKPADDFNLKKTFRLRTKDKHIYLTYKVDHFDASNTWVYSDEHETEIGDFNEARNIIAELGLKPLVEINNKKHTYLTEVYEIVFEEVENLGLFLEVERLNVQDSEKETKVRQEIIDFIKKKLDIKHEVLNIGKPQLMLKKLSAK